MDPEHEPGYQPEYDLTAEEKQQFHNHLRQYKTNLTCTVCKNKVWIELPHLLEMHIRKEGVRKISRMSYLHTGIVCSQCGHVVLFNSTIASIEAKKQ